MLTADYVKECLHYCPSTGKLLWKSRPLEHFNAAHRWKAFMNQCAGKEAGIVNSEGYVKIQINGKKYSAHRLVWLITYGSWPTDTIDHKNGIKTDNRIANLRDVTRSINAKNRQRRRDNSSGITGVSWDKDACKWKAEIWQQRKRKSLGRFSSYEKAVATRKAAETGADYHENHDRCPLQVTDYDSQRTGHHHCTAGGTAEGVAGAAGA